MDFATLETLLPGGVDSPMRGYRLSCRQAELAAAAQAGWELATSVSMPTPAGSLLIDTLRRTTEDDRMRESVGPDGPALAGGDHDAADPPMCATQ